MEPRIQYTKTKDGVSIAYWTMGEGDPPLVMSPPFGWSHISVELRIPELAGLYKRLASGRMVVRYDPRNQGLSQREVERFSEEEIAGDVEAVIERLQASQVDLFASHGPGAPMLRVAAERPDKVRRLITWYLAVNGEPGFASERQMAMRSLIEKDWELFMNTFAATRLGWTGHQASEWARFMRRCVGPKDVAIILDGTGKINWNRWLAQIRAPTLVLRGALLAFSEAADGRWSEMPDVRVVDFGRQDRSEELQALEAAVEEFLGDAESPKRASAAAQGPTVFRAVLFTDLVGHTEMMSRLGDERGREVLREHERITREVLAAHGGNEVKTMGDGFLASFGSVTKAVECAVALQRAFDEWNRGAERSPSTGSGRTDSESLSVRVGLNAGEPIEEEGDLVGATGILASRIAAKADGGEILVADTVRGLCSGKGFLFADRGEFAAKGFEEPVRLFEVSWRET